MYANVSVNNVCLNTAYTQECKQLQDSGYTYLDVRTPDENAQVQKKKIEVLYSVFFLCVSVSRVCVGLFCRSLF